MFIMGLLVGLFVGIMLSSFGMGWLVAWNLDRGILPPWLAKLGFTFPEDYKGKQ